MAELGNQGSAAILMVNLDDVFGIMEKPIAEEMVDNTITVLNMVEELIIKLKQGSFMISRCKPKIARLQTTN